MKVGQIYLKQMANFGYLLGDDLSRQCALIDPAFKPQKT